MLTLQGVPVHILYSLDYQIRRLHIGVRMRLGLAFALVSALLAESPCLAGQKIKIEIVEATRNVLVTGGPKTASPEKTETHCKSGGSRRHEDSRLHDRHHPRDTCVKQPTSNGHRLQCKNYSPRRNSRSNRLR